MYPLALYPLQAISVGNGYALFIIGYFCSDIYYDRSIRAAIHTYVNFQLISAGGGLGPLKHKSGSGSDWAVSKHP